MDFQTAYELSRRIEQKESDFIVVGFRRMRARDNDSWAIDIMNNETERVATIDEKDLWEVRLAELLPAEERAGS